MIKKTNIVLFYNILQKMKLHFLFLFYYSLFAVDFVSQVPLHRIPHCDIARSMIISKISS